MLPGRPTQILFNYTTFFKKIQILHKLIKKSYKFFQQKVFYEIDLCKSVGKNFGLSRFEDGQMKLAPINKDNFIF